ncbi:DegV family protein with EDD domain [Natranaerovirga pectinivora]|uniref:DegV family protein with EDD domain n=1 Tax=Natranaerovirga pectinivora TaxID=682400 RepID=A0A4R3MR15_9FIRM|nr:DegV family protein [Natranaerovirga pectinivora]TCT15611.1 DegV family protein with EDD domain [Natranaerovirga pectinivora]
MQNYIIATDATCDLPLEIIQKLGIVVMPMEFIIEENTYNHYPDEREMRIKDFYNQLALGKISTTTQINLYAYDSVFSEILDQGKDILYISFSSGLSGTFNASLLAVNELKENYSDRKIISVDSLCASIGEGLLVYLAALKKEEGYSIEQLKEWIENNRSNINHWFVVNDLENLKRGGRINAIQASVGNVLNLKPILSVDEEGKLISVAKVRGKKKSYQYLLEKLEEGNNDKENHTVLVGHADNEEDANYVKASILEKKLAKEVIECNIGPIIGSHTGRGMIALTFLNQ